MHLKRNAPRESLPNISDPRTDLRKHGPALQQITVPHFTALSPTRMMVLTPGITVLRQGRAYAWPLNDDGRHPQELLWELYQCIVTNRAPEAPPQIVEHSARCSTRRRRVPPHLRPWVSCRSSDRSELLITLTGRPYPYSAFCMCCLHLDMKGGGMLGTATLAMAPNRIKTTSILSSVAAL